MNCNDGTIKQYDSYYYYLIIGARSLRLRFLIRMNNTARTIFTSIDKIMKNIRVHCDPSNYIIYFPSAKNKLALDKISVENPIIINQVIRPDNAR